MTIIEQLESIVRRRTASRVDGITVDLYSASTVLAVRNALTDGNKERLDAMSVQEMISISFKMLEKQRKGHDR